MYGCWWRPRPACIPLAQLQTPFWAFKGGFQFCAYMINIDCPLCWISGEFNYASVRGRSLFWYLSLFEMCKAWHQYTKRSRELASLNSPQDLTGITEITREMFHTDLHVSSSCCHKCACQVLYIFMSSLIRFTQVITYVCYITLLAD